MILYALILFIFVDLSSLTLLIFVFRLY